jgi:hypothetical protein
MINVALVLYKDVLWEGLLLKAPISLDRMSRSEAIRDIRLKLSPSPSDLPEFLLEKVRGQCLVHLP